jgi:hypothetical protein
MKQWLRKGLIAGLILISATADAQVTGGQHAFEFLRLPQSPHISALGGINVSNPSPDVSLGLQNPALMRPVVHNQLSLSYNNYYSGISIANLAYGYHVPKLNTSFILGITYLNYGSFEGTDNIGNTTAPFRATDYAVSFGASRAYGERWRYGAALKLAYSALADKTAAGLMADVGITYTDTANLIVAGATAKNMGVMLQSYAGSPTEPVPFDLQLGISKRFAHLPLRVMATLHHLYEWDIRYNNPADLETSSLLGTPDSSELTKSHFADKLFRHFIFGAELSLGKRITLGVAYNHLHRGELAIKEKPGLAGFNFGAGIDLGKFRIQYARSYYHIAGAYNEFGLSMNLGRITGIGRATEPWGWNVAYTEKEL